jgi:hypothetical protein
MLRTQLGSPYVSVLLPSFLVLATGMASTMTPMTAAVMGSVPVRNAGVASAATNTSREIGGVFGIALLGAIVTSSFKRAWLPSLVAHRIPAATAKQLVAKFGTAAATGGAPTFRAFSRNVPRSIPIPVQRAVYDSIAHPFVHAMHAAIYVAVAFMLLAGIVSAIFVRSHVQPRSEDPAEALVG